MATILEQLAERSKEAQKANRAGTAVSKEWLRAGASLLRQIGSLTTHLDNQDTETATTILEARRRFADLADRSGDLELACELIGEELGKVRRLAAEEGQFERCSELFVQLLWYMAVHSVTQHRSGDVAVALDVVMEARRASAQLPEGQYLELRHRIAFALGRHSQSLGTSKDIEDAETHYTEALRICEEIAECVDIADRHPYSRYRLAVTLIALARLFLDRGELARALRESYAAKTLLKAAESSTDKLTTSYVDYLIGSILRQLGKDLKPAIELLEKSLVVFKSHEHNGHIQRCRNELAKAHLNNRDFSKALNTIREDLPQLRKSGPSIWDADDAYLEGRILLAQKRDRFPSGVPSHELEEVRVPIERCQRTLAASDHRSHYNDILTRALALYGELELELNHPVQAMEGWEFATKSVTLLECLTEPEKRPLDRTDIGWGWLVMARAYFACENLGRATSAMASYHALSLENQHFKDQATVVERAIESAKKERGRWFPPIPRDADMKALKALRIDKYSEQLDVWLNEQLSGRGLRFSDKAELLRAAQNTIKLRGFTADKTPRSSGKKKRNE